MFRDARALDRQRTASSFEAALQRYHSHAEDWFDGSVGSVDRRISACHRLLHSANSTVGRLDIGVSRRYLQALTNLKTDNAALADLRYALLTGASGREDVVGPPGWRTANPATGLWGNQVAPEAPAQAGSGGSNEFKHPAPRTNHPRWMEDKASPAQVLGGTDRRWVTLEASRFLAANPDSVDDSHELATRAHHYAAVKTSTFTQARSAALCEAFVAAVGELHRAAPRLRVAAAPPQSVDFPAELMFLA